MNNLKSLPVNRIKIDKSFITDISHDSSDEAMVGSIFALSQHLGLEVVAEGVETATQIEVLKKFNCTRFQGYYYSKPLSAENMSQFLKN